MTNEERDLDYEVVFSGGQELLGDRLTKRSMVWELLRPGTPLRRAYTKKADYWRKSRKLPKPVKPPHLSIAIESPTKETP